MILLLIYLFIISFMMMDEWVHFTSVVNSKETNLLKQRRIDGYLRFKMSLKAGFQLKKRSIGSKWTFFHLVLSAPPDQKTVENTSTLYHLGCGSQVQTGTENWYKRRMRGFSFVPIRPISCLFSWVEIGLENGCRQIKADFHSANMSRDLLFTLAFFWNVVTDLYLNNN